MTVLGCVQSSYLPWRGYFHIIQKSDVFVFHDDIQYTKQDWRNRNRVKTEGGSRWITVPVRKESSRGTIDEVRIDGSRDWGSAHWRTIEAAYARAAHFAEVAPFLESALKRDWERLSELNIHLIREISRRLGIETEFVRSRDLGLSGRSTARLVEMCRRTGATQYVSGPTARRYLDEEQFARIGVSVGYMDYDYPQYPQLHGPYDPTLSVIDLLFNTGERAPEYIWGR